LQINFEYGRKTIQARDIKIASISQVREQAEDLGLMDGRKRLMSIEANEKVTEDEKDKTNSEIKENKEFDKNLDSKIQSQQVEPQEQVTDNIVREKVMHEAQKYVVQIPAHAKKEDLHDLKSFLLEIESGIIEVYILLK
jgi:flagellum-specific peptidoglycan hydrolase FlgJ